MGIGQPWGLQCKRAGTGWALVHRPQWTQDPFPTPLAGLEPTGGKGLWSWAELVARAKAQSWRPRPQKGTIVVSERSRVSHQG